MTTTDTNITNLIINKLTQEQYDSIQNPSDSEFYIITDADITDNKSITKNGQDQIQTVGVINQNNTNTALKYWTGTRAQYEALKPVKAWYAWDASGTKYFTESATPEVGDTVYNSTKQDSGYVVLSISSGTIEIGVAT